MTATLSVASTASGLPQPLQFNASGIPRELAEAERWMIWTPDFSGVRVGKKPVHTGYLDPSNTVTLDEAQSRCRDGQFPGFVVGGEFVAFDFDDCILPDGTAKPSVQAILDRVDSYASISVSGTGLHCLCRVDGRNELPTVSKSRNAGFEFYPQSRFIALTGHTFGPYREVRLARGDVQSIVAPFQIKATAAEAELPHWSEIYPHLDSGTVLDAARAYIRKMEPAIEGAGGSGQIMRVSAALARGFLLDESEHREILSEYNATCSPPFDESADARAPDSLERKISEGRKPHASHHAPGRLLKRLDAFAETRPFAGVDISELRQMVDTPVDWIVQDVFAADQPTLFGARSKCLKTTQLADLAIALGSGTRWLGQFEIPQKRRVLFITGESTAKAIGRRLKKACDARVMNLADLKGMIRVETLEFPKLPKLKDCQAVKEIIDAYGSEVVILDPLYRGIPGDLDTNRLSQVGDAITGFARHCLPASLIISHHVTKTAAREYGAPPELEDMTGAGVAESCGNWWLVGRNVKYGWNHVHDLCISYGGRDEQCGAKRILFDERNWSVQVENFHEFIDDEKQRQMNERDEKKRHADRQRIERARVKILEAVQRVRTPHSKSAIRDLSGQSRGTFESAFLSLVESEQLVVRSYVDGGGRPRDNGYLFCEFAEEWDAEKAPKQEGQ